jgi:hypothetical protein
LGSALILPILTMFHVFLIDSLEAIEGAHEEVTVKNTFKLALIWLVISLPATYFGAYKGMVKQDGSVEELGARRNSIPRLVPLG